MTIPERVAPPAKPRVKRMGSGILFGIARCGRSQRLRPRAGGSIRWALPMFAGSTRYRFGGRGRRGVRLHDGKPVSNTERGILALPDPLPQTIPHRIVFVLSTGAGY